MVHGRQRSRNRSLDGTILKGDAAALAQEGARLQALGEKFVEDKEKLGACMERVKKSRMAAARTDASAAADEADRQKEKFDQMKAEAVEKLRLQMNQAAAQQRWPLARRGDSGRPGTPLTPSTTAKNKRRKNFHLRLTNICKCPVMSQERRDGNV